MNMVLIYLFIVPEERLDVINPLVEALSVVLRYKELHFVAIPVVDEEPRHVLGVKLHVDGAEVYSDVADGLRAVPGHEDHLVPGVGEHVVAIVVGMVKEFVDCSLLGVGDKEP